MIDRNATYVDGTWARGAVEVIAVENPATEGVIGAVPDGTAADADRAVRAARAAFPAWAATSRAERAEYLRKLHRGLAGRSAEIAETIATDVGTPMRIATRIQAALPLTDIGGCIDLLQEDETEERIGNSLVPAGTRGCRRGDHAVELPAAPDHLQDRARARRGLHRGGQAE